MVQLTKEQLQKFRDIRIHSILNIPDNRTKINIRCRIQGHTDGTPSLLIDSDNGFYCFGCGAKGKGAIDFTMQALGCSFQEALTELECML